LSRVDVEPGNWLLPWVLSSALKIL
jgi:hypothetical protein